MVRKYVRKTTKASNYTKDDFTLAENAIRSKILTVKTASLMYNIPCPTLYNHISGFRRKKSTSFGRPTALEYSVEKKLDDLLKTMERYGFGLSRKDVLTLVGNYINDNKIKTPFKNGFPNEDWWLLFSKRHNLSIKKPQMVENSRKKTLDPFIIYNYFNLLWKTMVDLKIDDRPDRIWNLDETSFCLDPSKTKDVGEIAVAATRKTHSLEERTPLF